MTGGRNTLFFSKRCLDNGGHYIKAKLKEIRGIGTAATQEGVIATLFSRGYLERKDRVIFPTDLGRRLIEILEGGRASVVVKPDLTALWEQRMRDIEHGEPLEPFIDEVAEMVGNILAVPLEIPADIPGMKRFPKCPQVGCPGFLRHFEKKGKYEFFACPICHSEYDDEGGKPSPKREISERMPVEAPCPTGCGNMARRFAGKYGYFWKCSCSPDTVLPDIDGKPVVKERPLTAACPIGGCKGQVIRLATREDKRLFWLCDTCGNFFDDADSTPVIRLAASKIEKKR